MSASASAALEPGAPLRLARLAEPLRGAVRERRLAQVAARRGLLPVCARGRVVAEQRLKLAAVVLEARRVDERLHAVVREVEAGHGLAERRRERLRLGLVSGAGERDRLASFTSRYTWRTFVPNSSRGKKRPAKSVSASAKREASESASDSL